MSNIWHKLNRFASGRNLVQQQHGAVWVTRGLSVLLLTALAVPSLGFAITEAAPATMPPSPKATLPAKVNTTVIAHRGGSAWAPENTTAAIYVAALQGAKIVEGDARVSRDGVAVVIHDATLERTTNGTGFVAQTDYHGGMDQLSAGLKFRRSVGVTPDLPDGNIADSYPQYGIPTVQEYVKTAGTYGMAVEMEIKGAEPNAAWFKALVLRVKQGGTLKDFISTEEMHQTKIIVDAVRAGWNKSTPAPTISSFNPMILAYVGQIAPDFKRNLLVAAGLTKTWEVSAGIANPQSVTFSTMALTRIPYLPTPEDWAAAVKKSGRKLGYFTINSQSSARYAVNLGADMIQTDFPGEMKRAWINPAYKPPVPAQNSFAPNS